MRRAASAPSLTKKITIEDDCETLSSLAKSIVEDKRYFYINVHIKDVVKFGFTSGCERCDDRQTAMACMPQTTPVQSLKFSQLAKFGLKGSNQQHHTVACRQRIEESLLEEADSKTDIYKLSKEDTKRVELCRSKRRYVNSLEEAKASYTDLMARSYSKRPRSHRSSE